MLLESDKNRDHNIPGTSSVCLSLRIPRVDFERYVGSSVAWLLAFDLAPKILRQRGCASCVEASPVSLDDPAFEEGDSADDSII